eukprot:4297916-Prymnesium_polylepis.1
MLALCAAARISARIAGSSVDIADCDSEASSEDGGIHDCEMFEWSDGRTGEVTAAAGEVRSEDAPPSPPPPRLRVAATCSCLAAAAQGGIARGGAVVAMCCLCVLPLSARRASRPVKATIFATVRILENRTGEARVAPTRSGITVALFVRRGN